MMKNEPSCNHNPFRKLLSKCKEWFSILLSKCKEWFSIRFAKSPSRMILLGILILNLIFLLVSALIISSFSLSGTENMGFLEAAFCTVTMILDAGCISYVIEDIGTASVISAFLCLMIVLIGMISFTGAVIGYISNFISNLIEKSNSGSHKLHMNRHRVILNWNSRAVEIVNEYMLAGTKEKEKVVILVKSGKEEIEKEIQERLQYQVEEERKTNPRYKSDVIWLVREGDVFSAKQLNDICIKEAQTIIILGNDLNNSTCKYEVQLANEDKKNGNVLTVKTLMQVADMTAADDSSSDQKIIVEITDEWTQALVEKIIRQKQKEGKCNILPIPVNNILGSILSQFSIMPELNKVYETLFSYSGARFFAQPFEKMKEKVPQLPDKRYDEKAYISEYLKNHSKAIPLTYMNAENEYSRKEDAKEKKYSFYYSAVNESEIDDKSAEAPLIPLRLTKDFRLEKRFVIILGHNSRCKEIMDGFKAFDYEWSEKSEDGKIEDHIIDIKIVDDKKHLEEMDSYRAYDFVNRDSIVEADIYDKDKICAAIREYVESHEQDTSVLILSDDSAAKENVDANALANLIYVQEIVSQKIAEAKKTGQRFDVESIDIVVEVLDPKHVDLVKKYSVQTESGTGDSGRDSSNNVIISNRYVSKMIAQIGAKDSLYSFYRDILSYDSESSSEGGKYESKEIYIKKVSRFFEEKGADVVDKPMTQTSLVRSVYEASLSSEALHATLPLGIVHKEPGNIYSSVILFGSDTQKKDQTVRLSPNDKLIVFSEH